MLAWRQQASGKQRHRDSSVSAWQHRGMTRYGMANQHISGISWQAAATYVKIMGSVSASKYQASGGISMSEQTSGGEK